jgi:hypothetical protein
MAAQMITDTVAGASSETISRRHIAMKRADLSPVPTTG